MSSINFKRLHAKNIGIKYILKTNSGIPVAKINLEAIMKELIISLGKQEIESFVLYQQDFNSKDYNNSSVFEVCLTSKTRFDFTSDRPFRISFFENYAQSEYEVETRTLSTTKMGVRFNPKSQLDEFLFMAANNYYFDGAMSHINMVDRLIEDHKYLLEHPFYIFDGKTFSTSRAGSILMLAKHYKKRSE
jgi:hypothetical protein